MAITIEEIESLLDDVGFSYNRNNSDTIVTIFNSYNYHNLNNEKIFTIVVQLLEGGQLIKFFHPMAYQLDGEKALLKLAGLESFVYLSTHLPLVEFIYDPADGEICPTFFIRIEDEHPTSEQFQDFMTVIPKILDSFHDSIMKIMNAKLFNQKLLDKSIQKYNQRFLSEDETDKEADVISEEVEMANDNPREQLEALAELLEHLDNHEFSDDDESSQEEPSESKDDSPAVELDELDLDDPELPIETIFNALIHTKSIKDDFPYLAENFPKPALAADTDTKEEAEANKNPLDTILQTSNAEAAEGTPKTFNKVLNHPDLEASLPKALLGLIFEARKYSALMTYRKSKERERLAKQLSSYGTILSDEELRSTNLCGRERFFEPICRSLLKMIRNDALLVGPSGVGKTAILREFTRHIQIRSSLIPRSLHGAEVFQLSADLLRADATARPQFLNRVHKLKELLVQHPKIILIINPMDSLLAKDTRRHEAVAAEEAIRELISSDVPVIGCMSPGAFLLMETKSDWDQLFDVYRIPEPDSARIVEILHEHRTEFSEHYNGITISDDALEEVTLAARRFYPTQNEPRRSVQFLDEVLVRAVTLNPPVTHLDRDSVEEILSRPLQPGGFKARQSREEINEQLSEKIIGQAPVIGELSDIIATRLSKWANPDRPRGVFLFGGPTGVGKTETAIQLAQILSGDPNNLIRIDCNTLQPTGPQKTSVIWPLIGVPPGYVGHGDGGLLSKIREKPNAVVLFDEFEKADPAVGKLLLQIIDTGLQQDNNGVMLDFRQAFIIFTSNLGVDYEGERSSVGFGGSAARTQKAKPQVDEKRLRSELKMMGYGAEFLARVHKIFLFASISTEAIAEVLRRLCMGLGELIAAQGYTLAPDRQFASDMAKDWEPRDGVRGIVNRLRTSFTRAMSEAELNGELDGVTTVALRFGEPNRERDGNALIITIQ